jgi:hypothetical protein
MILFSVENKPEWFLDLREVGALQSFVWREFLNAEYDINSNGTHKKYGGFHTSSEPAYRE